MRTLGIDLSANPAKTGACEVTWDTGVVTFLHRPTTDEQLVEAAQRADLTAIDVPLGWPDGFIDAVVAHRDRTGWPPIGTAPPEDRIPLRYRTTDLLTRTGGSQPLSVSSDLIGVAACEVPASNISSRGWVYPSTGQGSPAGSSRHTRPPPCGRGG